MRKAIILCVLVSVAAIPAGAVTFVDLGLAAPPGDIGGIPVTAFDMAAQAAIPDLTFVTDIPGAPCGTGDMPVLPAIEKRTVGVSWGSWSHGYTGPIFFDATVVAPDPANANAGDAGSPGAIPTAVIDLTMPCPAAAFYIYVEPNSFGLHDVTVTTDDGTTSGAIPVEGNGGANGFGFWADTGIINSVTVVCAASANGCAIGEFGIAESVPTLPSNGLAMLVLLLGLVSAFAIWRMQAA